MLYDEGTVISDFTPDNIAIQLFNATATALNCISQICCFHVALISCFAIKTNEARSGNAPGLAVLLFVVMTDEKSHFFSVSIILF